MSEPGWICPGCGRLYAVEPDRPPCEVGTIPIAHGAAEVKVVQEAAPPPTVLARRLPASAVRHPSMPRSVRAAAAKAEAAGWEWDVRESHGPLFTPAMASWTGDVWTLALRARRGPRNVAMLWTRAKGSWAFEKAWMWLYGAERRPVTSTEALAILEVGHAS